VGLQIAFMQTDSDCSSSLCSECARIPPSDFFSAYRLHVIDPVS
jgi:hypothetical protein